MSKFSLYTPIARLFNLVDDAGTSEHKPPGSSGTPPNGEDLLKSKGHRWSGLESALLQNFHACHRKVADHRVIVPEDVMHITCVSLCAKGEAPNAELARFSEEFAGHHRVAWIKRIWPPSALSGISLEGLCQVLIQQESATEQPGREKVDSYAEALSSQVVNGDPGQQDEGFFLKFDGTWGPASPTKGPAHAAANDPAGREQRDKTEEATNKPVHTRLVIDDADGSRTCELRDSEYVLGKRGAVIVNAHFTSGEHLILRWRDGQLFAEDRSSNGTAMNGRALRKHSETPVPDKAEFLFGIPKTGDKYAVNQVARVQVSFLYARHSSVGGGTPIMGSSKQYPVGTPVLGPSSILHLHLADKDRQWAEDVPQLPWVIGREGAVRIPEKNMAVSRQHLTILELKENGAQVKSQGGRGSYMNGQRQPDNFVLPYNVPLILGGTTIEEEHNPVQLLILPVGSLSEPTTRKVMGKIKVVIEDITKLEVDAIVNAANNTLCGGGGVDGAIHRAAGPGLLNECRTLGGCKTGDARITAGYDLPASFVIHAVGPVWCGGLKNEHELLRSCYRRCLELAVENGIKSLAFPAISCGAYSFPDDEAAEIAVSEVSKFLNQDTIDSVLFACIEPRVFEVIQKRVASLG